MKHHATEIHRVFCIARMNRFTWYISNHFLLSSYWGKKKDYSTEEDYRMVWPKDGNINKNRRSIVWIKLGILTTQNYRQ